MREFELRGWAGTRGEKGGLDLRPSTWEMSVRVRIRCANTLHFGAVERGRIRGNVPGKGAEAGERRHDGGAPCVEQGSGSGMSRE